MNLYKHPTHFAKENICLNLVCHCHSINALLCHSSEIGALLFNDQPARVDGNVVWCRRPAVSCDWSEEVQRRLHPCGSHVQHHCDEEQEAEDGRRCLRLLGHWHHGAHLGCPVSNEEGRRWRLSVDSRGFIPSLMMMPF
ncbi:hypothetical protein KC19_11G075800 [Ceratodon purpureus]|uniref:Uncharacterized protein n=1 Tax=Ceratodon purpureus TaxID=3225 RepID=A0A8T0GEI0_CERPU|nr:hypothetical protein KC19_11G075800 [Ceratodon purpureus]